MLFDYLLLILLCNVLQDLRIQEILIKLKPLSMTVVKKTWYVLCTKSRSEKQVYNRLLENNVEAFLPLYTTIRQWSDRRKKIELPFF